MIIDFEPEISGNQITKFSQHFDDNRIRLQGNFIAGKCYDGVAINLARAFKRTVQHFKLISLL